MYPGRPFGKLQQPSPLVPGDYRISNRRYTRIVAVDPGIKNLGSLVRATNGFDYDDKDDEMKEVPDIREISLREELNQAQPPAKEKGRRLKLLDQPWTYSNDQWKEKTGINLHHRLNQVRLVKHPHVQLIMADIPSACTSQYQDYIHRPRYLVRHLETLVDYHDKAKSSRWDRYKRKQRALHEICMSIRGSGTKDDTVVIWGNGNFTSLGRKQGALKRHARRYTHSITYDEYMTSQRCSHCARRGVPQAVADDPRLSGYARAQGKSGHVLMAKRTRANRLASVLEDAGCFGAQHCQPLHAVRYYETCSTVWDRDYNAARNILYCFLYERAFAERPRPFKRV
ncbi:hypothetical protein SeLEV6574_g00690 [Synchytrium endobioticum]|uniref:Uncharacterized protein n=1 Tax=Synchytrium endobioticum TaxID=286115 RepID=A0A507DGW9_9FUNG|nr:hypothetical protein SeLEV6574_g00690 [Synchytrium endobioticum]